MSDIIVTSKRVPAKPRSKNIPQGASIITGGGSIVVREGKELDIIRTGDQREMTDNNVISALRFLLEIKKRILTLSSSDEVSDDSVFSSARTKSEIDAVLRLIDDLDNEFLSKTKDERTEYSLEIGEGLTVEGILRALIKIETASLNVSGNSKTDTLDVAGKATARDVEVANQVTSLNAVIRALATIHNLTVENTADIMHGIIREYISSSTFVSGFLGEGFKVWKDDAGLWHGELDMLTVRKLFTVFELVVQKVVHQGGMVIRSAAGGKITKVTDGGSYWKCEHDSTDDFVTGDQVLCQVFTGVKMKRYWRLVTSAGAGYFNLSKTDCEAGSATPEVGDEVAVLGNRTNAARQSAQIDCAVGANAPYRDDYAGINSYSLVGKLVNRTGNLSGIVDDEFGSLSGPGLYTKNLYAKGRFRLTNGKTVENAIEEARSGAISAAATDAAAKAAAAETNAKTHAQAILDALQIGGRNLIPGSGQLRINSGKSLGSNYIPGQQYTISIERSVNINPGSRQGKSMMLYCSDVSPYPLRIYIPISDSRQVATFTYPLTGKGNLALCATEVWTGTTDVTKLKIEKGAKATDWTPAPEDVEAGMAFEITKVRTDFDVREGQISAKVAEVNVKTQQAVSAAETATGKANDASVAATRAAGSAGEAAGSAAAAAGDAAKAKGSADAAAAKLISVTEKESSINQTAGQIATQVSEVTRQAGIASNAANNASGSASAAAGSASAAGQNATQAQNSANAANIALQAISTKQTQINQTASEVSIKAQAVVNKAAEAENSAQYAKDAAELAMAMSKGKMLYRDPAFKEGMNGTSRYNNRPNSHLNLERVATGEGNPTDSTHMLKLTVTGTEVSPGFGGFTFKTKSKANKVFITRMIAKIPEGRTLSFATDPTGDNPVGKWLTPQGGTGKWEEYAFKRVCGATGEFRDTNYFCLVHGDTPTLEQPLIWYVAYATVFDVTDAEIDYLADAAAKYPTKTEFSSQLSVLNSAIMAKVSQTDFNALGTRMADAEAKITPSAINLAVKEQITTAVNNVQVGGRNYIILSKLLSYTPYNTEWQVNGKVVSTQKVSGPLIALRVDGFMFIAGEPYTISGVMTKNGSPVTNAMWITKTATTYATPKRFEVNDATGYFECAMVFNTSNMWIIHAKIQGEVGDTITIDGLKLEKGTKATDWTPAPEDVEADIALRPTTEEIKSGIGITAGGINIFGKELSLASRVTFSWFDSATQANINGRATPAQVEAARQAAIASAASDAQAKADAAKSGAISAAATDAQNKANIALANAKSYTDVLRGSLKGLAYEDMVSLARLDNTIVEGGYLKTSLIEAGSITADKIMAGDITGEHIMAGSITADRINVESIRAAILTADAVEALNITARKVSAMEGTFNSIIGAFGGDTMSLSPHLVRFKNADSEVVIGANTMPASAGGGILPMRITVNKTYPLYGAAYCNSAISLDVRGAKINDDHAWSGNHALFVPFGDFCGFRLKTRRIARNLILDKLDSVVLIVTGDVRVDLPISGVEDGQMYFIRNCTNSRCYIYCNANNISAWTNIGVGNNVTLNAGNMAIVIYDAFNNKWNLNWVGNW